MEITKREIYKTTLIGIIVISIGGTILFVLPEFFDLETQKVTYTGFPTYSCTEPFEISSCLNKTALKGYTWSNSGKSVIDINFELKP